MYRSTPKERDYKKYRKGEKGCYFCSPELKVIVGKFNGFYIMRNNFPYDFWDGQEVGEHLLMVSKRHSAHINNHDMPLMQEYAKLLNKYYQLGYDIFTRTVGSPSRSQNHFHTHLIKTFGKKFKKLIYNESPYRLTVKR